MFQKTCSPRIQVQTSFPPQCAFPAWLGCTKLRSHHRLHWRHCPSLRLLEDAGEVSYSLATNHVFGIVQPCARLAHIHKLNRHSLFSLLDRHLPTPVHSLSRRSCSVLSSKASATAAHDLPRVRQVWKAPFHTLSARIICGFSDFLSHLCASDAKSSYNFLARVITLALMRPRPSLSTASASFQTRAASLVISSSRSGDTQDDEYPLHLPRNAFPPLLGHQERQYGFLNGPQEATLLPLPTVPASRHSVLKKKSHPASVPRILDLRVLLLLLLFQTQPWRSVSVDKVLANCAHPHVSADRLFRTRAEARKCVRPQRPVLIGLDNKELFVVEGCENWRSTPGQPGGARKMRQNAASSHQPPHRHTHRHKRCNVIGTSPAMQFCICGTSTRFLHVWNHVHLS